MNKLILKLQKIHEYERITMINYLLSKLLNSRSICAKKNLLNALSNLPDFRWICRINMFLVNIFFHWTIVVTTNRLTDTLQLFFCSLFGKDILFSEKFVLFMSYDSCKLFCCLCDRLGFCCERLSIYLLYFYFSIPVLVYRKS